MEFLNNSLWQSIMNNIGNLFTAASFAVAFIALIASNKRKEVSYRIITVKSKPASDGKNLYSVVLRIANTGNEPVKLEDHNHPIEFDFGVQAQIKDAKIGNRKSSDLKPEVIQKEKSIKLT